MKIHFLLTFYLFISLHLGFAQTNSSENTKPIILNEIIKIRYKPLNFFSENIYMRNRSMVIKIKLSNDSLIGLSFRELAKAITINIEDSTFVPIKKRRFVFSHRSESKRIKESEEEELSNLFDPKIIKVKGNILKVKFPLRRKFKYGPSGGVIGYKLKKGKYFVSIKTQDRNGLTNESNKVVLKVK